MLVLCLQYHLTVRKQTWCNLMMAGAAVREGTEGALSKKASRCSRAASWRAPAGARTGNTARSSAQTGLWSLLTTSMHATYVFASTCTSAPLMARSLGLPGAAAGMSFAAPAASAESLYYQPSRCMKTWSCSQGKASNAIALAVLDPKHTWRQT